MCLHFRRRCDKSNKHIHHVQRPERMSSEDSAGPRCGLSSPQTGERLERSSCQKQPWKTRTELLREPQEAEIPAQKGQAARGDTSFSQTSFRAAPIRDSLLCISSPHLWQPLAMCTAWPPRMGPSAGTPPPREMLSLLTL